ncbi:MAG: hypothetical protein CMD35_05535 [Flavobacteriales bacterium]|nr:hypothetical protein [Flavobacteriales bacterium]
MKFFQLTRNERAGLIGVLVIFIVIILIKYFEAQVNVEYKPSSIEHTQEELSSISKTYDNSKKNIVFTEVKKVIHIAPFEKFNPNLVDAKYWNKIGFENKIALRLEKFIQSGYGIKNIKMLSKVYGMKEEWIKSIEDSLVFERLTIDINTASAESFQSIHGIGEKISNRIIKYRNSLGGFYSVQQLKNVYGMDSNVIAENYDVFTLSTVYNKININTTGLNKIMRHPLINRQKAEEIIRVRSVFGSIDSVALQNIFTLKEWEQVKYYLKWKD